MARYVHVTCHVNQLLEFTKSPILSIPESKRIWKWTVWAFWLPGQDASLEARQVGDFLELFHSLCFFSRNTLNPRLSYAIRENVQGGVQYTYFPRKGQTFVSCARKRKSWLGDFKLATWSSVDFRAPLPDAVKTVLDEGISLFRLHQNRHGRYEAVSLLIYNSEPYLSTFYRQEISR